MEKNVFKHKKTTAKKSRTIRYQNDIFKTFGDTFCGHRRKYNTINGYIDMIMLLVAA